MNILEQLKTQADQVEVVHIQSESTQVGFEANRLKSSQVQETSGIAVRVVRKGRLGFAASSDDGAMEKLVTNALESAAYGDQVAVEFPAPEPAPDVRAFDAAITELPIPRLVEIGRQIIALVLEIEPEARVNVNLERGVQHLTLRNHTGAEISFKRSPFSVSTRIDRIQGDDVLIIFDRMGATVWDDDYLPAVGRWVKKLKQAQRRATIASGRMPVLFAPSGALALVVPLELALDGKSVHRRMSPMTGKIGTRLFDEKITILDDGTLDGRFGSAPFDDEGVPHRRNVLVEQGVLKGFVYDLKTAAQAGVESTGNGSRRLFSPPSPSTTNLVVQSGDTSLDEMIAGIDQGLLVEHVLGLGQGNVISGAFSNSLGLAFKIEKGEVVGRVKDVSIAGNVYELLPEVAAISRESEWVYFNYHLPYILLPDMNVVAKA
jgi:PmbA protein